MSAVLMWVGIVAYCVLTIAFICWLTSSPPLRSGRPQEPVGGWRPEPTAAPTGPSGCSSNGERQQTEPPAYVGHLGAQVTESGYQSGTGSFGFTQSVTARAAGWDTQKEQR